MKPSNLVSILVLSFGIAVQADQTTTSDIPNVVLSCQESQGGAPPLDGRKTLILSRDQFGQSYLTVMQEDQFAGNSNLIENLPLDQKECEGFVPCELYEADNGATQFFVNFLGQTNEGHLESSTVGSVDFNCE